MEVGAEALHAGTADAILVTDQVAGDAVLERQPAGADRRERRRGFDRQRAGRSLQRAGDTSPPEASRSVHAEKPRRERLAPDALPDDLDHERWIGVRTDGGRQRRPAPDLRMWPVVSDQASDRRGDAVEARAGRDLAGLTPCPNHTMGTLFCSAVSGARGHAAFELPAVPPVMSPPLVAAMTSGDRPCRNPASICARRSSGKRRRRERRPRPGPRRRSSCPRRTRVRAIAGAPTSANATTSTVRRRPDPTSSRLPPGLSFGARSCTLVGQ